MKLERLASTIASFDICKHRCLLFYRRSSCVRCLVCRARHYYHCELGHMKRRTVLFLIALYIFCAGFGVGLVLAVEALTK